MMLETKSVGDFAMRMELMSIEKTHSADCFGSAMRTEFFFLGGDAVL